MTCRRRLEPRSSVGAVSVVERNGPLPLLWTTPYPEKACPLLPVLYIGPADAVQRSFRHLRQNARDAER